LALGQLSIFGDRHPEYIWRYLSQEDVRMYNKPTISLEQAQAAITAMIAEYSRDANRRKVDMAVVDDAGNLLAYARMDRCLRPTYAIRKAYTAATRSMTTAEFAEQLSATGRTIESYGDAQLVAIPGGVTVFHDGVVVGVGGLLSGTDDEAIAKAGMQALGV
jgi:uncharacterized protein GlcG (DUF336 family)